MGGGIRIFSVDDANKALPLVKSIVSDMVEDFKALKRAGRERRFLQVGDPDHFTAQEERLLKELSEKVERLSDRLRGYVEELSSLGVDLLDMELGRVVFPTYMAGVGAYLAWQLGEDKVLWWFSCESGFSGRALISRQEG